MLGGWSILLRNKIWHLRVYVPQNLQAAIGKREITRSLGTGSKREALLRQAACYCMIEREVRDQLAGRSTPYWNAEYRAPSIDLAGPPQASSKPGITLEKLIDGYNANKKKNWAPGTFQAFATYQSEILRYFGAKIDIGQITPEQCQQFRDDLMLLPPNFRKLPELASMTISEIAQNHQPDGSRKVLSSTTVNAYLAHLSSLMKRARDRGWIRRNPLKFVENCKANDAEQRDLISTDDLNKIFTFSHLREGLHAENLFWLIMIALYAGMRLGEICQLTVHEIIKVERLWIFRISKTAVGEIDRRLKTPSAQRDVPIHSELIRLGLLEFVTRPRPNPFLFPDVVNPAAIAKQSFGAVYGKRAAKVIRGAGIEDKAIVFHSLRHTFREALDRADIDIKSVNLLCGWAKGPGMAQHYGGRTSIKKLNSCIQKVQYPGLKIVNHHQGKHAD